MRQELLRPCAFAGPDVEDPACRHGGQDMRDRRDCGRDRERLDLSKEGWVVDLFWRWCGTHALIPGCRSAGRLRGGLRCHPPGCSFAVMRSWQRLASA